MSGDDPEILLDAFRAPDGDAVLKIGDVAFRFSMGSQPFEQTTIYKLGAQLVDAIVAYKQPKTDEEIISEFRAKNIQKKQFQFGLWFRNGDIRDGYLTKDGIYHMFLHNENKEGVRITYDKELFEQEWEIIK